MPSLPEKPAQTMPGMIRGRAFVAPALLIPLGLYLTAISPHRAVSMTVVALGLISLVFAAIARCDSERLARLLAWRERLRRWLGVSDRGLDLLVIGLGFALGARAAAGDGPQVLSLLAIPLWLGGIFCTLIGVRRSDQNIPRGSVLNRVEWLALIGLTVAAFVLRAWQIDSMPYVLSGDEGSIGLTSWEFMDGLRNNPLGLGWFSFPALYFWIISWSQAIFGRTVFAIRVVSALAGAVTIPATFLLLRAMFNKRTAWLGAIWLACFHQHIFFSRVAYNNIFDGLTFTLAALTLWSCAQSGRRTSFLLAGLTLGISQYFYTTARLIPIVLGLWIIHLNRRQPDRSSWFSNLASLAWTALITAMPLALLYLQHPDSLFFTAGRVSMIVPGWIEPAAAALGTTPLGLVLEQIWITTLGLTIAELQGVYFGSGVPMLFGISAVLFLLGLFISLAHLRDPRHSLPILTLLATVIVGGLSIQAPNAQRMLLLPPMLALWIAVPLDSSVAWLTSRVPSLQWGYRLAAAALLVLAASQNLLHLFRDYFPNEDYGSLNGEVTMEMINILRDEPSDVEVYFIGGDRMFFNSIPSLPYLLPGMTGEDLEPPFNLPDEKASPPGPSLFFILPEQTMALEKIPERYNPGVTSTRYNRHERLLFYVYRYQPE